MKRLGINVDIKTRITSCKSKIIVALEKELNYYNCIDQRDGDDSESSAPHAPSHSTKTGPGRP